MQHGAIDCIHLLRGHDAVLWSVLKNIRSTRALTPTRRLHIGGEVRKDGWEVFNASAGPKVDHIGQASDLSRFEDGAFLQIYASHVLEHFGFRRGLREALREWQRVLVPGGELWVSVPDLGVLAGLFVRPDLTNADRFQVMRMIYGGQLDPHDFHKAGFDFDILKSFLEKTGFVQIERVSEFGLFDDSSSLRFAGVPISLNVIARRPPAATAAS